MKNKIILGTVQFGLDYGINNTAGKPTEQKVFELLNYAFKRNVRILDTADAYGSATELLGNYHESHFTPFLINTKFKKSTLSVQKQLDASLKSLKTDQVNTYFYHSFEDFITFPELLKELIELKEQNTIKKIGVSVYSNIELKLALENIEVDVIQLPFNLLDNLSQRGKLLAESKIKGKEIQVRSVFLQGLFFKKTEELPKSIKRLKPYLEDILIIAKDAKIPMEHLALQYALQQKEIDHVIIGVDNIEQLQRNLSFSQMQLPTGVIETINKIIVKETELLYPKNW
jgi:uncharacterized protein